MKTVKDFLKESREMAWHNRLCYSKTYLMNEAREGCERLFEDSVRDCEIVEELIRLVKKEEAITAVREKLQLGKDFSLKDIEELKGLLQEIVNVIS
ncbi:MAG TPA: hypothetical protein DIC60_01085 [Lachnospiraceae bacterium]|nr:hypothetical protein [Lachnospiraceae bacterium]